MGCNSLARFRQTSSVGGSSVTEHAADQNDAVIVFHGELLALNELHDGAAFEIDGRNQHLSSESDRNSVLPEMRDRAGVVKPKA